MRKRTRFVFAATQVMVLFLAVPAGAQSRNRFNPVAFLAGEKLWVTTDVVHKGTLGEARSDALVLDTSSGRRTIPILEIERVHRRLNGKVVGTLVGAGIGLAS